MHSEAGLRYRGDVQPSLKLGAECAKVDGFRDAGVAAGLEDARVVGNHRMCRHRNHGKRTQSGILANPRGQRQTVLRAQLNVQQNGIGPLAFHDSERLLQSRSREDLESFHLEPVAQELSIG